MEKTDTVREEINVLISQTCGEQVANFFDNTYAGETLPIFLHHSFLVLKELSGEQKAREQLNNVLRKYSVVVPYE
jgi:hypothetical protein